MTLHSRLGLARGLAPFLALTCLVAGGGRMAAQTAPACNELCAGIKEMVSQRQSAFESQKGAAKVTADDPVTWQAKTVLPGAVNCRVITGLGLQYICLFKSDKVPFEDVLAAATAAAPDGWLPRKVSGADETTVYFGPTRDVSGLDVTVGHGGAATLLTVNERIVPGATSSCPQFCTAFKVALAESALDFRGIRGAQVIKDSTESRLALPGSLGGCQINMGKDSSALYCRFPEGMADAVIREMKKAIPDWQVSEDRRDGGFVRWIGRPNAASDWVIELVALNDHAPVSVDIKSVGVGGTK